MSAPAFGHAETRGERIADYFMFAVEVYLFVCLVAFAVAGLSGFLKPNATSAFRAGFTVALLLIPVTYWVVNDARAIRAGRKARGESPSTQGADDVK